MSAIRQNIVNDIQEFLAETGVTPTRLGLEAVGDCHFWRRLQRGEATLKKLERVEVYMHSVRQSLDLVDDVAA